MKENGRGSSIPAYFTSELPVILVYRRQTHYNSFFSLTLGLQF